MKGDILALDLATVSGWAEGPPGGPVRSGSIRFAPSGASHGEIALGAVRWLVVVVVLYAAVMMLRSARAETPEVAQV